MRVLVVEDNEIESELLRSALVHHGYDVTVTSNGVEALEAFRAAVSHRGIRLGNAGNDRSQFVPRTARSQQ